MISSRSLPVRLVLLLAAVELLSSEAMALPNFVVFVADDMAWNDCGAYGHPYIRTPNIDRLPREGMRFDRAYLTCSSCSPSRCSMLTGRYPHSTGAGELHLPLPADQVLFTTPLRQAGYYTAAVGKWHLGQAAEAQVDLVQTAGAGPGGEDRWVDVLRNRPPEKPFFLWLAAYDPHRAYQEGTVDQPHALTDVLVPPIFPDTEEVRRDLAMYYDEISRLDRYVGDVLQELERQGVLDDTFVLFISDNGRSFPRCKTTIYEDGVRTPFIVRYPPLAKPGSVSQSLVSTIDIAPTVMELAGLEPLESFQGRSFQSVLKTADATYRDAVFSEHNWHDYQAFERSIATQRFRYIRNWLPHLPATPPADAVRSPTYLKMQQLHAQNQLAPHQAQIFHVPRPEEELYDIQVDPHCLHNLASDHTYAAELAHLRECLAEWQGETNDSFPGREHVTPDGFDRASGKKLNSMSGPHPSLKRQRVAPQRPQP